MSPAPRMSEKFGVAYTVTGDGRGGVRARCKTVPCRAGVCLVEVVRVTCRLQTPTVKAKAYRIMTSVTKSECVSIIAQVTMCLFSVKRDNF